MKAQPSKYSGQFNATRMALAGAVGDYIDEPDMTVDEILQAVVKGGSLAPNLTVVAEHAGKSGYALFKEITLQAQGLKGLMEISYNAAKLNQEFV